MRMIIGDYETVKRVAQLRGWNIVQRQLNKMAFEIELIHPYDLKKNEVYVFDSQTYKRLN